MTDSATNSSLPISSLPVLRGKRIALIGCAVGFGRSIALEFGRAGAHMLLFDKNDAARETALAIQSNGGTASFHTMDALKPHEFSTIFAEALGTEALGGVIYMPRAREERDFKKTKPENWDNDIDISLRGAFFTVQALLPYLERSTDADRFVLFMSSTLSSVIGIESVGYHVSKAGIEQLTRYLAVNVGPSAIRVNAIQIGMAVKDEVMHHFHSDANTWSRDMFIDCHPIKRTGTATDIVNAAFFLASPYASFITGQSLCVDGGITRQDISHVLSRRKPSEKPTKTDE